MASKSALRIAFFGMVAAIGLASSPTLACKGAESLLRDDFSDEDPAWGIQDRNATDIAGGAMKLTSEPGHFVQLNYQGMTFPAADVCIDIVAPSTPVKNTTQGGLGFWNGKGWTYAYVQSDGTAGVEALTDGIWVNPVPARKFDGLNLGTGAVNKLRVVWKGPPDPNANAAPDPTVQVYINDKFFIKFKTPPNLGRIIALFADSSGSTYQFKNLVVTQ